MGALEGVRVVSVADGVAGGFCTKLLADYGADVVCVEPPSGMSIRGLGPFADPSRARETGALHLYLDTNKRSVAIDVTTATGRDLLMRLLEGTDVLVDDNPPGTLDALGLDRQTRASRFPQLVTTQLTAFGQSGPYSGHPAVNLTALAASGLMAMTGEPDREPLKNGGFQADYVAGLNGFTASLAGLWAARDTGQGDDVDVSAMEAIASTLELNLVLYCYLQLSLGRRRGNIMSSAIGIYPCKDGYLGVHAMPRNWPALMRFVDAEWALSDERFTHAASRLQYEDELQALVYAWTTDHTKREAYERAGAMHAPVAYVHDMDDLLESPHLAARGYFQRIDHPVAGTHTYPGAPIRMSETPSAAGRAPLLGEHTAEVLTDRLGLTARDLDVLRAEGVIFP